MEKTLTVSELSRILGVSVNTTWKKINRKGLTTGKQLINNREITVVFLNDDQLEELISEMQGSITVNNHSNSVDYEDSLHGHDVHEGQRIPSGGADVVQIIETVVNYSREMNDQVKEYVDRVINAEKQVKLLEDSENRKKQEFIEIRAKCKELESRIVILVSENSHLKRELESKETKLKELEAEKEQKTSKKRWFSFK